MRIKQIIKSAFIYFLLFSVLLAASGCESETPGDNVKITDSKTLKVDRDKFYGACYCAYEAQMWHDRNPETEIEAMAELGAKTFRLWVCSGYIMKDAKTFDENKSEVMRNIIKKAQETGLEVIGMNNHWFSGSSDNMAVPSRNLANGSNYEKFLLNYEETWYQLVKKFPEITTWELGNEWNNDVFLHPYEYENSGLVFTFSEKVNIATDMLYYASKGVHRANSKALTVLGGLVDVYETGFGNAKNFLEKIYQNISGGNWPSTNPDRYFQIVAWHPYNHSGAPLSTWVDHQKKIYDVILKYEGHDKPVMFTEIGISDYGNLQTDAGQGEDVKTTVKMIYDNLPFVRSFHWFRMFDESSAASWGGALETGFGLFTEPDKNGKFKLKAKGKAYTELTGASGDFSRFE